MKCHKSKDIAITNFQCRDDSLGPINRQERIGEGLRGLCDCRDAYYVDRLMERRSQSLQLYTYLLVILKANMDKIESNTCIYILG